jgi:AcrR family transcriptional regulator
MRPNKKDELVAKALEVFYRKGFHATGMDLLVRETGVSKTSMYKHFRTKEELILAALQLRDLRFRGWFSARVAALATTPEDQLLVLFDVLGEWFLEDGFCGCMFVKASAEFQHPGHAIHQQAAAHKQLLQTYVAGLAQAAGYPDPDTLARQLLLLKEGAITAAVMGDSADPAGDAKAAAAVLLAAARTVA